MREAISVRGKVNVAQLLVDPDRFQYKLGADPVDGAGLALDDVEQFDSGLAGVITVWRGKDDKLYVVNGHQRTALARRTGVKQMRAQVLDEGEDLRFALRHNVSDVEARTYGALINIAEGRGTAIDAAKLIRDADLSPKDLKDSGVSLSDRLAKDALALAKLDTGLFQAAICGQLEQSQAVVIGLGLGDDPKAQVDLWSAILKAQAAGRDLPDSRIRELILLGRGSGATMGAQDQPALFGAEVMARSLMFERAEIVDRTKRLLAGDRAIFGNAVRNAQRLETGGTRVDRESGQRIKRDAVGCLGLLNQTVYSSGTAASEYLAAAARELGDVAPQERPQVLAKAAEGLVQTLATELAKLGG